MNLKLTKNWLRCSSLCSHQSPNFKIEMDRIRLSRILRLEKEIILNRFLPFFCQLITFTIESWSISLTDLSPHFTSRGMVPHIARTLKLLEIYFHMEFLLCPALCVRPSSWVVEHFLYMTQCGRTLLVRVPNFSISQPSPLGFPQSLPSNSFSQPTQKTQLSPSYSAYAANTVFFVVLRTELDTICLQSSLLTYISPKHSHNMH